MKNQKYIILCIFFVSIMYGAVEIVAVLRAQSTSESTNYLWSLFFALAIAFWSANDAKTKHLYQPYEYSFFVFLIWPFVLPYHLIKTRGVEGLVMFTGILSLYLLPFLSGIVAWAFFHGISQ